MDLVTTVMSAINPNQENDSLKFHQNSDGTFSVEWDKNDPNWSWMNNLTSKEIQIIIEQALKEYGN